MSSASRHVCGRSSGDASASNLRGLRFRARLAPRMCLDPELGLAAVAAARQRLALMARPSYIGAACMRSQSGLLCQAEALLATCRTLDWGFGRLVARFKKPS